MTRSHSYKKNCKALEYTQLNSLISINPTQSIIHVEPRMTIEELVRLTIPFNLVVPIIPEFKGVTVGGALLGGAAESGSHQFGIFFDICIELEILQGGALF